MFLSREGNKSFVGPMILDMRFLVEGIPSGALAEAMTSQKNRSEIFVFAVQVPNPHWLALGSLILLCALFRNWFNCAVVD